MPLINLRNKVDPKKKKRVGRGGGSGHGTHACRGLGGQGSRAGGKKGPQFEGGQTPFHQKMPKLRGFKNVNNVCYEPINVGDLDALVKEGKELDLSKGRKQVKLLGDGEVTKAFTVKVHKASKSAIEKIEKAGGKVEILKVAQNV